MRMTVNVPDNLAKDLKAQAMSEHSSVSSVVSKFIEYGIKDMKRRAAKNNILALVGKIKIDKNALKMLDEMRDEDDRF